MSGYQFLWTDSASESCEFEEMLKKAGYSPANSLKVDSNDDGGFSFDVYSRDDQLRGHSFSQDHDYLVFFSINGSGSESTTVAISSLPDLIAFLKEAVPVATSLHSYQILKEKREEEIDEMIKKHS